jgi:hypothetical protein
MPLFGLDAFNFHPDILDCYSQRQSLNAIRENKTLKPASTAKLTGIGIVPG